MTDKQLNNFNKKILKSDNCWLWIAYRNRKGYGQFRLNKVIVRAHRLSYEIYKGHIPDGLEIDHLCRVRHCVNPDHLEAVTPKVNTERGLNNEWQRRKTHCPTGHEYTVENTKVCKRGKRSCRKCENAASKRLRLRKSEGLNEQ